MALSRDKIEQLAPDQASLSAAIKLMKPANWPVVARNSGGSLLWGECQGSGATPYRVVVSPDDIGYKCTCPSRKFPCKHSLAIMLMSCQAPGSFGEATAPDWVNDWLSRRRSKSPGGPPASTDATAAKPARSLDAALAATLAEPDKPIDPKAAARAEAQRQRAAENREAAVLEGLDDLERWISDELNAGLTGFAQRSAATTRTLSTRLVDSKAHGLAQRLVALAAQRQRFERPMAVAIAETHPAAGKLHTDARPVVAPHVRRALVRLSDAVAKGHAGLVLQSAVAGIATAGMRPHPFDLPWLMPHIKTNIACLGLTRQNAPEGPPQIQGRRDLGAVDRHSAGGRERLRRRRPVARLVHAPVDRIPAALLHARGRGSVCPRLHRALAIPRRSTAAHERARHVHGIGHRSGPLGRNAGIAARPRAPRPR